MHKAGFVNIIGKPNVGKSTLMNALVGQNLSIITSKAQTTRHRVIGIVNGDDFQIIYSDTPGMLESAYKLHDGMMQVVKNVFSDADILLYVTEPGLKTEIPAEFAPKIIHATVPVIVVVNKTDLSNNEELNALAAQWQEVLPQAKVLCVSALHNFNVDSLFQLILSHLPENPAFYPKEEVTDRPMRFFVSEIIREKIFLTYQKEIPYCCEVEIEEYKEEPTIDKIRAIIHVMRDSQKGIVIGHQGEKLKRVGTMARKDMEKMLDKQVYLEMHVKVSPDWREDERMLKRFGYM
ncbi:MAG: GTPase Era [Flavobacteriales bacterium]